MKTIVFIILLLVSISASAQSTVEVNVPPGDLDALRLAMNEASAGDPSVETIINTSGTFNFTDTIDLPDVHAQIYIRGRYNPITFVITKEGSNHIVLIGVDGRLKLENVEFKGGSVDRWGGND
jgi:hypothetical protein